MSDATTPLPMWSSRRPPTGPAGTKPAGPAGTRPANRADPTLPGIRRRLGSMSGAFVSLFLEVEAGRRPRRQLAPLITPMLYARLAEVWVRGGEPGRVVATHVAAVDERSCDVVAVVRRGQRCGAISLRLVRSTRGWLVHDIAVPEHGPLPLPAYPVPRDEPDDSDDLMVLPSPQRQNPDARDPDWFTP